MGCEYKMMDTVGYERGDAELSALSVSVIGYQQVVEIKARM